MLKLIKFIFLETEIFKKSWYLIKNKYLDLELVEYLDQIHDFESRKN